MNISVINHASGKITDEEVQHVIRAINRQIAEDFAPYWGMLPGCAWKAAVQMNRIRSRWQTRGETLSYSLG
jgi:hypothetical protein